jgi:hypothetical protein
MIAFWPWAQKDPLRNPFRAQDAISRFWETMVVLYDGQYVPNGQVSRWYLPHWLVLTLPETYVVAAAAAVMAALPMVATRRALGAQSRKRVIETAWLLAVALLPVAWIVVRRTPLYDGQRHFLFVIPPLAVVAGVAVTASLRRAGRAGRAVVGSASALAGLIVLADMIALHPYQAVYFNRLFAGGLKGAVERFDTDYWCLSYKEGAAWLLARHVRSQCEEKIRVAGHSIVLQTAYYLQETEEGRRLFKPVSLDDRPHYALATTRFGDHRHTPGTLVHTVERQGATLLYVFEVSRPPCAPAP